MPAGDAMLEEIVEHTNARNFDALAGMLAGARHPLLCGLETAARAEDEIGVRKNLRALCAIREDMPFFDVDQSDGTYAVLFDEGVWTIVLEKNVVVAADPAS